MNQSISFLRHCLTLAERGRGHVKTNPLVGCVITDENDQIVAEGYHAAFGDVHAEVMALKKCEVRSAKNDEISHFAFQSSHLTLYVSLEPCCSKGKQPPCTDAIIARGIRRVVFGARDPSNAGADILRKAGIEVIGPVMEAECRWQNKGFFSVVEKSRPYVMLKKAIRSDGSINGKITNEEQDEWSHTHLRATHDAILVGAGTILKDNPRLNVRYFDEEHTKIRNSKFEIRNFPQPFRIILDPKSAVPSTSTVLTDENSDQTIVIREKLPIPKLLDRLLAESITSVLVEGGPTVWKSFEENGCVDEVVMLTG